MERADKVKTRWWTAVVFVVALFVGGFGYLTYQTHELVQQHNADLQQTLRLAQEIRADQELHSQDLTTIKAQAAALAADTAVLKATFNTNHGQSVAYLKALCAALPACTSPK